MNPNRSQRTHGQQWGMRVGMEMVASTMLGLGAGFLLDRWLDTRPAFLILFAIFGMAAGFLNLYQVMVIDQRLHSSSGEDHESRSG